MLDLIDMKLRAARYLIEAKRFDFVKRIGQISEDSGSVKCQGWGYPCLQKSQVCKQGQSCNATLRKRFVVGTRAGRFG